MSKLEQAARQALEALESCNVGNWSMAFDEFAVVEAITALREVLAVSEQRTEEQEPVAWALTSENGEVLDCISHTYKVTQPCTVDYDEPLYAAPVHTVDLTDDEIAAIVREAARGSAINRDGSTSHRIARAVIAADREKNQWNS